MVKRFLRVLVGAAIPVVLSCSDSTGPQIVILPVSVGTALPDSIDQRGTKFYATPVAPGSLYSTTITGLDDDLDLYVFDEDGTFTNLAGCMIGHTLFFGTTPESCVAIATGNTLYIAVDASDAAAARARYTLTVQLVQATDLTLGTPREDTVASGAIDFYRVSQTIGAPYSFSLTGLTDSATIFHLSDGDQGGSLPADGSPKALRLNAFATTTYLAVDGSALTKPQGGYVVLAMAAPVLTTPIVPTSGPIPARAPTVGWVETRLTSTYRTEGLSPGTHTVSVFGATGDIDFEMFGDGTYSMELDCTLQNFSFGAKECTVTGTAVYFRVGAGPVNRDGAGYILLVW